MTTDSTPAEPTFHLRSYGDVSEAELLNLATPAAAETALIQHPSDFHGAALWLARLVQQHPDFDDGGFFYERAQAVIDAAEIAQPAVPEPLTDDQIDRIADNVVKAMPDGISGFAKGWGWRQFARELLDVCAGHSRATQAQPATHAEVLTDERESFKAWAQREGVDTTLWMEHSPQAGWLNGRTADYWTGWKARAAIATQAAQTQQPKDSGVPASPSRSPSQAPPIADAAGNGSGFDDLPDDYEVN